MSCQARQVNDQMHCHACGLQWDVNDPEPPECLKGQPQLPLSLGEIASALETDPVDFVGIFKGSPHFLPQSSHWLPVELSDELAADMARAYRIAADGHAGVFGVGQHEIRAMRAAYRLLLDRVTP